MIHHHRLRLPMKSIRVFVVEKLPVSMDAFDLFKKLGAGAKFDFKRFRNDAERLHVSF